MDLSMHPAPVSEYDKQRTGPRFTVRSANSPSYSLTRRPCVRKPRCFSVEERESNEEVGARERYGTHAGINGTNKEEDHTVAGYQARTGNRSGVKGQCEEKETISTKLNQNDTTHKTTEFGTDRSTNCNPASESRGRTDWRTQDLPNRSKSLDCRAGASSPDRRKTSVMFMLSTKQGLDERRPGVEGVRGKVMSSIQAYNSAGTSNVVDTSQPLDRASRGQSLPTRLRSLSGHGSGVRGTAPSFGPSSSIMERIEKLYGSTGSGKTDHRETSTDLVSPQQRSYDKASGVTFPRHLASGERSSSTQSRTSFTPTQKDTSETSLSPVTSSTRERWSGVQWPGQIQGRYSEEGGGNWGRGLEEVGTRSLDRARSRYSVAAQIRAARAAAGITAPPQSHIFLEEERSSFLRDFRERRASTDYGAVNGTLRERTWQLEEQEKETVDGAMKSSDTDEDVFESNPQKITTKATERKKFPERSSADSAASVRNKISQFEALTQRTQDLATGQVQMPRRAFSVPTQLGKAHDGVKRGGSAKAIGGLRQKWEGLKEGEEAGDKTEEKATGAGKKLGSNRSLSVDEFGLRLGRKEREGNVNEGKEIADSGNRCAEDFGNYSSFKSTLEIPLKGGAQRLRRNFYIDEKDFYQISSPEEASERPTPSLLSSSSDTFAGVQKTTLVISPVSDDDKTPTNSPYNSPFVSPTTQPEKSTPIADTSVLTRAAKAPEPVSPPFSRPFATSSHINLPDLISPDVNTALPNGKKQVLDMDAWVAGLNPKFKVWNDDEDDYDDDDESTQRDEDSNYDSDSGESSVTITSSMSQSDHKSFCVSLSDLCNFAGVDYESENDSDEWQPTGRRTASLSSDMSVLSCVSVMPSEELDRLLEDVRSVGDSNLQDYNDVQVAVLHKDIGVGLGFSLAGGVDQNKPVTVHKVFHTGVASQEGSIREGDQVLSINGTALCGYAHWEALRVLRRAKAREMGVVVLRRGEISSVCKGGQSVRGAQTNTQGPTQTPYTETGELMCVRLEKNNRDLGFSLEGGVDSNRGNRPLTVQKIFQGGPVDKVRPGDELEEIEGISVVAMRRLEAWTLIRKLPSGPVDVVIRRPLKHLET
ncbi:uncharacterized protein si:dkey-92i15.4 [Sebastes umbrosus]|uniref:uncharacterized protein si:dkey-92i15.4 n=1 Tax=Sebastes umbrosus TaxID=72105 RepID=UPI0018A06974|nr:uncharacterized protein si:dkey-92i15.4 [Sebastes umbrosus]XP_037639986.1 uncharacterized protein si:dkey-92i15.4 [Sebastes umbrosus]XP_037639987.1 uncharacterized protein si:dkey-92i15.4 [Sebastes umbrosus]XP_037639988.1 uncharacterized protein si:dkey-92i15.4 [Sebastes umbrosus]